MDDLQTITQVTRTFGVTTRTLRYYEQIGLLHSKRMEGYSYRVYDEETCQRLREIILLRKLRIPLKEIQELLGNHDVVKAIHIFEDNISGLEDEINSLSTIRNVLKRFVEELQSRVKVNLKNYLLEDDELISMVASFSTVTLDYKEGKNMEKVNQNERMNQPEKEEVQQIVSMEELNQASKRLNKLTDKDVRIVYLPPSAIASYHYIGDEPEAQVNSVIDKFVRDYDLIHKKPELRHYGFNAPCPIDETGYHGYEIWVTIPEEMEVPEPLVKKYFEGGLYAAHMIPFGAFDEWGLLEEWLRNSNKYEFNGVWDASVMFYWLEEHLNYVNHVMLDNTEPEGFQLDLLIPIREK